MSKNSQSIKYLSQQILNPSLDYAKRTSFSHPHLLNAIDPKLPSILYFEYCPLSLSQLIVQRKPNKLFIERDILALLRGLSSCLAYMQLNGVSHGNIHPIRVFFDEYSGVFKIYDEELLMGANRGFKEAKSGKRTFLAPELIGFYRSNQISEIRGNSYKADIFALGLTMIEAACLKSSEEIYDIGSLTINAGKIEERLLFMMRHYSRELVHVIRLMVEIDEEIRPDACELYAILGGGHSSEVHKEINKEIDLKKSWDSFENLYKNSGLRRVTGDRLRKSMILEEEKEKEQLLVYRQKKSMANSCIFINNKENSPLRTPTLD